ncbi:MAG TPA: diaminopimelate epimerase [Bacteroidetes bacterium]|nr:diaminopimelate epimerase [Bacteroidota bacterium]
MQIIFNKYHGTGNDFIIIDNRTNCISPGNDKLIKFFCDRHKGVGSDGLILIDEHEKYDFEMKYFNADGREGTMCGNGGRCAAAFAEKTGIGKGKGSFMASDGEHRYEIKGNVISVSLCDTRPPVNVGGNSFIDTGSPHYIINVPDCEKVNVYEKGKSIRWSDSFAPGGTNVDFVEHKDDGIFVRTYERGVENETLSCGTGVAAAAISSRWGKEPGKFDVRVETLGGILSVSFLTGKEIISNICLSGPAEFVFAGIIDI